MTARVISVHVYAELLQDSNGQKHLFFFNEKPLFPIIFTCHILGYPRKKNLLLFVQKMSLVDFFFFFLQ